MTTMTTTTTKYKREKRKAKKGKKIVHNLQGLHYKIYYIIIHCSHYLSFHWLRAYS